MKFCYRCKCALDTNKERHILLENLDGKKSLSKLHMHEECWKEWVKGKEDMNKLQSDAVKMLNYAKKLSGYEEEVVF